MSERDKGYKEGWVAGYEAGGSDMALVIFEIAKQKSKPNKISDPGPSTPDGLSYEEIYGSVVYHQNNKKDN